ncbi:MAG: GAF domain-containing protein [Myxococcota bacterium]|nr:GAF domain-containing protein [Myxococcota bacterium]
MRWLVEVTALGKTDTESLHIESESWQNALQIARGKRGETSPLSGFSIELLNDGCRALDPLSRLRYAIRRAPPDAETRPTASPSAAAPRARSADVPGAHRSPTDETAVEGLRSAAPPPAAEVAAVASGKLVFRREQDATNDMPLTYREYAFLMPVGTSEGAAETLLLTQLASIRSSLERSPPGKLVNIGVFDQIVQGKPRLPPLATLCWKDWRVDTALSFPRKQPPKAPVAFPVASAKAGGSIPTAPRDATVSAAPVEIVSREAIVPPAAGASPHASVPVAELPLTARRSADPAVRSPSFVERSAAGAAGAPSVNESTPFPPSEPPVADEAAAVGPGNGPAVDIAPTHPMAARATPLSTHPPVSSPPLVGGHLPVESLASTAAPLQIGSSSPPSPAAATLLIRPRGRAEDLITDLFEVMHDLHFLRDAVEGGYFCLDQAMDKMPSRAGIVHLYDIDRRSFLVTSARGANANALLLRRHPEKDPILSIAMRRRRAVLMTEALRGDPMLPERYAGIGGAQSLLVAPVMQSGRFLGAIELVNPLDGQPFTEAEANALTYIADQFAEFVATRGVVTDPEQISVIR